MMTDTTAGSYRHCKPMLQTSQSDNDDVHIVNTSHDPHPLF